MDDGIILQSNRDPGASRHPSRTQGAIAQLSIPYVIAFHWESIFPEKLFGNISAPSTVGSDLTLAFTKNGFAQDSENFRTIAESNLTDTQSRRFFLKNRGKTFGGNRPDLQCDCSSSGFRTQHCRMPIADGPQAIYRRCRCFTNKFRTRRDKIGIQLEPAHQRAIDGKQNGRIFNHRN